MNMGRKLSIIINDPRIIVGNILILVNSEKDRLERKYMNIKNIESIRIAKVIDKTIPSL